ncbi:MAG: AbrB/MazE/SpoVT family DNA-binding domain-containing protein [Kiritimatiellia bacterium]
MTTTIDTAGRIVVPKKLRDAYHLRGGTPIEIVADGEGLRIRVPHNEPSFVEKEGVLVQCGQPLENFDSTSFLNQLRESIALKSTTSTETE